MRKLIRKLSRKVISFLGLAPLNRIDYGMSKNLYPASKVVLSNYLNENLWKNPRYIQSQRLPKFSKSIYTNNGTEGIIEEIFHRIGERNKYFVEFGTHSFRNNTTYLLIKNWKGLWMENSAEAVKNLKNKLAFLSDKDILKIQRAFVTAENIEELLANNNVPREFDLLSIDIDGNDYWVWKAMDKFKPAVVIIEYNASFPADIKWVMEYNPNYKWDGTNYFGASLKSLELLGLEKGYVLVGCDFTGVNAFFVREEFADKFEGPFTSEYHYEEPRYYLNLETGHPPGFGPFLNI
ncbi:MAG: hypothetical protein EA393_12600 [Bacteroidetes bacterium]|nr:MAG: hypothetical protein EA393_12600 [Bacteroidota bacterium]